MKIVLGLGNEGPAYRRTRHNVGFMVADVLAERTGAAFERKGVVGGVAWVAETAISGVPAVLAKPTTLMNASGRAAVALLRRFRATPADLLVVYDDADLEFGRLRLRPEGGAGGHNGIRSLMDALGTPAFERLKLGVRGEGREDSDLADYVLKPFLPAERPGVEEMVSRAADAVELLCREGFDAATRRFNAPVAGDGGR